MLQGVLIGVVGSAIGLAAGYTLCYFADKYRWIPLEESVYSLSFVPFEAHWLDGLWIAGWRFWSASWRPSIRPATPPASPPPKCCGTNNASPRYSLSVKFTSIWVTTSTGLPFNRVGL